MALGIVPSGSGNGLAGALVDRRKALEKLHKANAVDGLLVATTWYYLIIPIVALSVTLLARQEEAAIARRTIGSSNASS